jgi:mono/diheme cytochrome c family protein
LHAQITDPESVKPDTDMPKFGNRLTPEQLNAIAKYLEARK